MNIADMLLKREVICWLEDTKLRKLVALTRKRIYTDKTAQCIVGYHGYTYTRWDMSLFGKPDNTSDICSRLFARLRASTKYFELAKYPSVHRAFRRTASPCPHRWP